MSDIGSSNYSEAAASNNATTPNGWPEGQNPSTVNDCARENMAGTKRWYNKLQPTLTTGGTTTAYTLTSATQAETAYYLGQLYSFVVNATCGATPSLNIDGLGALSLRKFVLLTGAWTTLSAGDLQANQIVTARYNSSAPGFFDIVAVSVSTVATDLGTVPTGCRASFLGTVAQCPVGWVTLRGNSIGDGSSGATERANADTVNLFTLLWANTNFVLQNSSGSTVSRGANAAADYAAHCRLVLPNYNQIFGRGRTDGTAPGGTGGSNALVGGATSGSLNFSATTSAPINGIVSSVGNTVINVATDVHQHTVSGTTTGNLSVTGTTTPPYIDEVAIIKL